MTLVAFSNVAGQARCEPIRLTGRRRRLSTIVARHRPVGRRILVSVHRNAIGEASLVPSDATVRLRAMWSRTLVGPRDVVVITILPLGGGGSSGGGGKSALGIGLAIASIALIAIAPYAAPALAGAAVFGAGVGATTGTLATAIQVGMVVGGVALGAAAQLANGAGAKAKNRTLYSVSGGGNVPRPGARKPLLYGTCWSTPPLSQRDFFRYDGDTMVLTKRMTLGLGKFQVNAIRAGESTFWTRQDGLVPPFNVAGNAVEFLYETPSHLAVGDAISSGEVAGQELPRPNGNPAVTPWFRLQPQGVVVDQALLSWSYPSVSRTSSAGRQAAGFVGVVFTARRIDPVTGTPIGAPFELLRDAVGPVLSPSAALRFTRTVRLPAEGAYEVQGQNLYPEAAFAENKATWDELVGIVDDVRIRPVTTEIVIQVRAGPGLSFAAFSDVGVLATRILPVWNGNAWIEQPTRKAVWAVADLVRNEYGLDRSDGFDAAKALHYAGELTKDDTFDGALPEVSSYWEAAGTVLLPVRADPVKVGAVHSFVRDESRAEPRHVLTRRQIVRDSGSASFQVLGEGGDVIVEFDRDGDPKRPDEARFSYGVPSRTPKRYKVPGIVDGDHAYRHAKWLALVSVFRGASRTVVTEWDGRLIYPGDHVLCDLWFLKGPSVFGVAGANGNVLALDCDTDLGTEWKHGSIRTRLGREWGILRMRGAGPRAIELHPADLAVLEAQFQQTPYGRTRLALAEVLARDGQDPTTIVIGDLEEIQATYVVRAAIPTDADHVRIEMLFDDTRIWALLGEEVFGPLPVDPDSLADPLQPKIPLLRARCERIETGIEVVWSLVPAKGARSYAVWLSYDGGVTREPLHNGPGIDGRAPMRQSDSIVTVIAVAYGATGLPGPEKSATFTTVAPVVRGELVDVATLPPIDYSGLTQDVRTRIENALTTAQKGVSTAQDALTKALASLDNDATNASAIIAEQTARVNQDGALATRIDGVVAKTNDNAAAITSEQTARTNADGALAQRIDAVVAKADNALAGVTSEQTARVNADGALGLRIDAVTATANNALAGVTSEQTARINADGALGQRIDAVVATANNALAGVSAETTARINADGALAGQITAVSARTDAGTASGRSSLRVSSGIAGVQARFETLLAIETGGQIRGAGYYIDLMPDGSSRFVIDANGFYITSNGQISPAFAFDGYTLTIPSLRVTQQAILPGAATEVRSLVTPGEVDGGGFSNDWREVPGTGMTLSPDANWAAFFSGTAILSVTAQGNANLFTQTRLAVAIGLDGVPYQGSFAVAVAAAGGSSPPVVTNDTPIQSGPALFEILPAGTPRRVCLLYQLTGQIGSGRIKFGQLKLSVSKR
ncbi:methyl-accepting chemotaxis protein [Methylorubrum sp. Q1]|uniref:methyl-accepting chemotaxis protein n=1 Tax=Methylorubrum sp. Q1 TaxID=2562453 RepID=UPI001075F778|nr:methyl-accepting chemotaxis protein [Methylorubrum sp. Q1]TFZ59313.1 methyl-accepting chemotaxis protein [Methylorubrum sp. Q1]